MTKWGKHRKVPNDTERYRKVPDDIENGEPRCRAKEGGVEGWKMNGEDKWWVEEWFKGMSRDVGGPSGYWSKSGVSECPDSGPGFRDGSSQGSVCHNQTGAETVRREGDLESGEAWCRGW
ncbi:uncharacterized protein EI90DRAFT_3019955 [Cantharellus anzutake]|uniref:uncharacterized protein n=1 Tax=Cantharellus anzutake TaxID=1750568 RepID=UPI0019066ADE|nr:uncharacterized protein EI90DRAFT_3019955 [Cantharellus anzutake]KAF8322891.1 hypothetical protein EI90DRAFT_3019955 [Cantharellus anzutake]